METVDGFQGASIQWKLSPEHDHAGMPLLFFVLTI
jgi:hypothetical protein